MKEKDKVCIYYLAQNKDISNLVFNNEVNSLEFVQIIGSMEIIHLKDYQKRDLFLKKHGEKLFRNKKPIKIKHEAGLLTVEEIDSLLNSVDRNKYSLNELKKIDYNEKIHEYINTRVFSQEEIDRMLTPIGFTFSKNDTFFVPGEDKDFTEIVEINVDKKNPVFCSVDGVLFDKAMSELLEYPINKDKTDYVIPDGIKSIAKFAFYGCKRLVNINLPESLEIIKDYAFAYCKELITITLPIDLQFIGEGAFKDCPNLETVTLSRKTRIGYKAFEGFKGQLVYRD